MGPYLLSLGLFPGRQELLVPLDQVFAERPPLGGVRVVRQELPLNVRLQKEGSG